VPVTLAAARPWSFVIDSWADPADRPVVDAFAVLGYEPNCKPRIAAAKAAGYKRSVDAAKARVDLPEPCGKCPQEQFHAATEDDVLYGGSAGGGKSCALLMEGIRACVRYPGIWVAAYRRTYDELEESLLKELQKFAYAQALGARWNITRNELTFPTVRGRQSRLRFRYADSEVDATRRQGGDYQLLLVDERTLMAPGVVDVLAERLRSADDTIPVIGLRSSANPGGPSHGEVKGAYIDPTDEGAKVITDEHGRTRRFIPARLSDNPYLDDDESYHRILNAIPDPARRKAMKDGDWNVFAGQYFERWRRDRHVVDPFPVPEAWDREAGVDYGYAHPWVTLYGAYDGDGRCWVYRELDGTKVGQTEQAQRIVAAEEGEYVIARHADTAMWAKVGESNTIAETYAEEGVDLVPAVKDRLNGWARVQEYLGEMPACQHHRAMGWETCPRMHVFSTCEDLIRTIPLALRDPKRPEDVLKVAGDDWLDAVRYLLMGRGAPFEPVAPLELPQANQWDMGDSAADYVETWDLGGAYDGYSR
jgi:hypothetical protein